MKNNHILTLFLYRGSGNNRQIFHRQVEPIKLSRKVPTDDARILGVGDWLASAPRRAHRRKFP